MEKEEKNNEIDEKTITTTTSSKVIEPEFVLQWGKRIRCVRFKEPSSKSNNAGFRRKISSRIIPDTSTTTSTCNDPPFSPSTRINRVVDGSRNGKLPSPEKGERYYSTRGSMVGDEKENGRLSVDGNGAGLGIDIGREDKSNLAWPKLYIALSSKEKEEDFLAMKGCKLPQRPKKRAKLIQRTLLLVSPGAWLPEMSQERYEVREKKTPRKRPRGLKAMGSVIDSDSE